MARRRTVVEAVEALTEVEALILRGESVSAACREIGVTPQSYYRWRREHAVSKARATKPCSRPADERERL